MTVGCADRERLLNKAEEISVFATLYILSAGVVFRFGPGGATTTLLAWSVVLLIVVTMATCAYATFSCVRYRPSPSALP